MGSFHFFATILVHRTKQKKKSRKKEFDSIIQQKRRNNLLLLHVPTWLSYQVTENHPYAGPLILL